MAGLQCFYPECSNNRQQYYLTCGTHRRDEDFIRNIFNMQGEERTRKNLLDMQQRKKGPEDRSLFEYRSAMYYHLEKGEDLL